MEFTIKYVPAKVIKGHALANFLADHPCITVRLEEVTAPDEPMDNIKLLPWKLFFDGSKTRTFAGVRILILSSKGYKYPFYFNLELECTNNQAEYEALILGLELLLELEASMIEIIGDSKLVI